MNLLGYWNVLTGQRRVVLIGVGVTVLLAFLALYRVSPSGISLRTPPVYVAESTLFVTAGETPPGTTGGPSADYLGQIYAQLAQGDAVRRLVDPTGKRKLEYTVQSVTGSLGTPLPIVAVSAYGASPRAAIALANRVGTSLRDYVASTQTSLPKRRQASLAFIARPQKADVFQGVRLTPPLMLFVLGITATVFIAFTRHNLELGRAMRDERGEEAAAEQALDIPRSRRPAAAEPASVPLQPVELPEPAEEKRSPQPARQRGRWSSG